MTADETQATLPSEVPAALPDPGKPQSMGAERTDVDSTWGLLAFVFGLIGVFGAGLLFSIAAVVLGAIAGRNVRAGSADNPGQAKWGFWLGIVGFLANLLLLVVAVAVATFGVFGFGDGMWRF